jgi:phage terminase large subunit-like protein
LESCSRSPEGIDFLVHCLTPEEIERAIAYDWCVNARDDQLAPLLAKGGGRWHTWLLLGGRGSGKTRAGAEWIRAQVEGDPTPA